MKKTNFPNTKVKSKIVFPHLVDSISLGSYITDAVGCSIGVASVEITYCVLTSEQERALYKMCRDERFGSPEQKADVSEKDCIDVKFPLIGMNGGDR